MLLKLKPKFCYLIVPVIILFTYIFWPKFQFSVEYDWPIGRNGVRYILYWDGMWEYRDFGLGVGDEIFKNCPVNNCYATINKTLIPIEEFDALIFHGVQYTEWFGNKPAKRNPKQVYIYFNLENPFNTPLNLKYSGGFFNWTLTYR